MPLRLALLSAAPAGSLLVLVIAACGGGGGSPGPGSAPSATAARTAPAGPRRPPGPAAVAISAPRPGVTVRSGFVTVTGTADPQQTIQVRAGCPSAACRTTVFTGLEGRWRAQVRLAAGDRARRAVLRASYAAAAGPAASVRVRLAPAAPRARTSARALRPARRTSAPPAPASSAAPPRLLLVGDSLAVGLRGLLPAALPGWTVEVDGRVGRALGEGLSVLSRLYPSAAAGTGRLVLAASLFTNEAPTHVAALTAAVEGTVARAGPRGCAVWATVARPPLAGVSYAAANRTLEQLSARSGTNGRLVVIPWAREVAAQPKLLRGDHVHPTRAGYALLAQLYAQAAQACL